MEGERQPEGEEIPSQFLQAGGSRDEMRVENPIPVQPQSSSGSQSRPYNPVNPVIPVGTQFYYPFAYQPQQQQPAQPHPYDPNIPPPIYTSDPRMQMGGHGVPINQQQAYLPPIPPMTQQMYYAFEHEQRQQQQLGRFPWGGVSNYNYRQPNPQAFCAGPTWQRSPIVRNLTPRAVLKFTRPSAPVTVTNTGPEDVVSIGSSSEDEESNDNTIDPDLNDEDTGFLLRDEYDELMTLSADCSYSKLKAVVFVKPTQLDEKFENYVGQVKADWNERETTIAGSISITEVETCQVKVEVKEEIEIEEENETDPWSMQVDPDPWSMQVDPDPWSMQVDPDPLDLNLSDDSLTSESPNPDDDQSEINHFFKTEPALKINTEVATVGNPVSYGVLLKYLNINLRPSLSTTKMAIIGPSYLCDTLKNELMKQDGIDEEKVVIANTFHEIQDRSIRLNYVAYLRPCDDKFSMGRLLKEVEALLNCVSSAKNFDILLCRDSENKKKCYPSTKSFGLLAETFGIFLHPLYYNQQKSILAEAEYCASRFRTANVLDPLDNTGVKVEQFQSN